MKKFNIMGVCVPERHYMVDLSERLQKIKGMVEEGLYFSVNRGRQYGKTTILYMLERYLRDEYLVISLSFESADDIFESGAKFAKGLLKKIADELEDREERTDLIALCRTKIEGDLYWDGLAQRIRKLCEMAGKPVVLIIDEVDKSSDNQIFVTFLGMLRDMYQARQKYDKPAFQTVILAGVHDIRHLRLKIRPDEEHKKNSPWNIAAPFNIDMAFSAAEIEDMLKEYESEHGPIKREEVAKTIYDYTTGYPFLVSKICKVIDEEVGDWSAEGVTQAVKSILGEDIPLFESLKDKLIDHPQMSARIQGILFSGETIPDNPDDEELSLAKMFGFLRVENNNVKIANRIFETRLYNYYMTTAKATEHEMYKAGAYDKNQFVSNGMLDMDRVVERFAITFHDIYGSKTEDFVEEEGRKYFLLFLKPIINGTGNYYIESQTRDQTRTDIIVDYLGHQYVIEMKIWRGDAYNKRGEKQLKDYLEYYHLDKGWMISFCFNKNKQPGVHEVKLGDKTIVEAVV